MSKETVIVTGGAGFIGSCVARTLVEEGGYHVIVVDKLTYAGHLSNLGAARDSDSLDFERVDIADPGEIQHVLYKYQPNAILHLAAETHVDRSITGPEIFLHSNVVGTFTLLQESLRYWRNLGVDEKDRFRIVHVSTDEVFGELSSDGKFSESSPYNPSSPYSATKAAADHLARAWQRTYGLPVVVTNCSNNYGPFQYPEKLIPVVITNALAGEPIPVYGRGENVRDWLYVEDHAKALIRVMQDGEIGETYLIGGDCERKNIDVVHTICRSLQKSHPGTDYASLIEFVDDRPGHDWRYAIDARKIKSELGWAAEVAFKDGIERTVRWYTENQTWCKEAVEKKHAWLSNRKSVTE